MAAGEDELESLIGKCRVVECFVHRCLHGVGLVEQAGLLVALLVAPDAVDRGVASGRDEPRARVGRRAVARPPGRGRGEGLLRGLLGEVEVSEEADQGREHATPLVMEDLLEDRYRSTTGRTSMAPPMRAAGMREATSIALSRS